MERRMGCLEYFDVCPSSLRRRNKLVELSSEGIVVKQKPAPSFLLGTTHGQIDRTLRDLHALTNVPENEKHPVRPLQPSFRDFLLDQGRCCDVRFWIERRETHDDLTVQCLRVMSSLTKHVQFSFAWR